MAELVSVALPKEIVERIHEFHENNGSGWIQINYNEGYEQSWKVEEYHRIVHK